MKDPYRELAEKHKQPLEKVTKPEVEEGESLQRPVHKKADKQTHYPLITALLVFFIASPFIAVYAFKEEKPVVNQIVNEQPDQAQEESAQ
ncbi:hypothetical protein [Domibacillus enclensis]|uniref:Uncharacterized protein n=1 Tax=Domibacillus enclensis TaxID=1017273 RepID=A0A1N6PAW0_9BACI|nr:hypothetical protein [Domibacillus enclensis]OXS80300.1 hypothetical protein B1B05_02155 [Domibacillus enclensis]SIQ01474.1 hypothetical protein SAMN05443094_101449 [Domibacillus enclensis]